MNKYIIILTLLCSRCAKSQIIGVDITPTQAIANANYVFVGNSYVTGYPGHTPASTYFAGLAPFASNGSTFTNEGIPSQVTAEMITAIQTQVYDNLESGVINFVMIEEGGNDIGVNGNVSAAITRMQQYCDMIRAYCLSEGITVYLIVSTKIPRDQASLVDNSSVFNQKLVDFNVATLADNNTHWNYVIRPELESVFATWASSGYDPDDVHPNDVGQAKYADLYKLAVLALTNN